MLFNDRRANARALKAANGPSLAPKNYKSDTTGRAKVNADPGVTLSAKGMMNRKSAYNSATKRVG
jgi:hypothetical protein